MKFGVIVADPPWSFDDRLKKMKAKTKRSAVSQYETMTLDEICSVDVRSVSDPEGCVLALWVPSSLLSYGLTVMSAWGYVQKQTYVWVKQSEEGKLGFGMGRIFRQSHEIALIGTSGKTVYAGLENKSQRSVLVSPSLGHSTKPEGLQDSLELMWPNVNKLEMFARRHRLGWTCLGDEIDGQDIRSSIRALTSGVESKEDVKEKSA